MARTLVDLSQAGAYWHQLTDTQQARLRYRVMRSMAWTEWDEHPRWWWDKQHVDLLQLKVACGLPRHPTPSEARREEL